MSMLFMGVLVRVGVVGMIVPGRRVLGRKHVDFRRGNTAAAHLARFEPRAYIERGRRFGKVAEGNTGIDQRAQQHVAANAGKALQISNSHQADSTVLPLTVWRVED